MKQSGNALFLILIAVALFAALSYAVTQSGRGGGNIDRETAALRAAETVQYASLMQNAIQKMQLFGCSDTEISFLYDSDGDGAVETNGDDDYYNPNTPDNSCMVFDQAGGGLTYQLPPNGFTTTGIEPYRFSGAMSVSGIGVSGVDELAIYVRDVSQNVCLSINSNLGIDNPGGDAPVEPASTTHLQFEGTYDGSSRLIGDQALELEGEPVGCYYNTLDTRYEYYHVLIGR